MVRLLFVLQLIGLTCCCRGQVLTSSDLPIIKINTNGVTIPNDPKIDASLAIINRGASQINQIGDSANEYNGAIGIEVRGQSSQQFPMKSYSIELRNSSGNSIKRPLFGLPAESDWVMYAPYTDKTLMHNFLAYSLSRQLGHWAANCRFAEVVLNDEYIGIYVFMERIKKDDGRVKITKLSATDTEGAALTGGYIFSIDKEPNGWFSQFPSGSSGSSTQFSYIYPKPENIVPRQKAYIQQYTDSFETALNSSRFQDTMVGWRKFADEQSFIDFFIVNEVSRNVDGYRLSSYFHKDRNGKIIAGPVWDFDLAFRNADYCNGSDISGWSWQFNNVCPVDYFQVPFWWDRFRADTAFQAKLLCRWQQLRTGVLSEQQLFYTIDSVVTLTAQARERHFIKWPTLGQYVWPNPSPIPASYPEEISVLKSWLTQRLRWIDDNLPSIGVCAKVPPVVITALTVRAYPNPAASNVLLTIASPNEQSLRLQVYDNVGRIVHQQALVVSAGKSSVAINAAAWAHGLYYLQLMDSNGKMIRQTLLK